MRYRVVRALVIIGLQACRAEPRAPPPGTIALRDSAGVAILAPATDPPEAITWSVGRAPELLIDEAHAHEPLHRVRAGRQFADGSFVIANDASHELRFYSRTGALERSAGRAGSGPNEFRSFGFLEVIADSVWVYDRVSQRITVMDRKGTFVRDVFLGAIAIANQGRVGAAGVFGDGSLLLTTSEAGATTAGLRRSYRRHFVLRSPPDGSIGSVGRFFRGESYWTSVDGGSVDVGRPFAREGLSAVHGAEWFYTAGDLYRVEQYDMGGRLRGVYAFPGEPRTVVQGDLDEYLAGIRAEHGLSRLREALLRRAPLPERLPAYGALLIDREGNVWAATHAGPKPPACWHVYQRRPLLFATVCFPDRFTVLDVAGTSVLGVLLDENDVERIARYRVVR